MRRPTRPRLTLLAVAVVAVGMSVGLGSDARTPRGRLRSEGMLTGIASGVDDLAAVVRVDTDGPGSVWARRTLISAGSLLLASAFASGLSLDAGRRTRRRRSASSRHATAIPLRTAVGRRAPPRAVVIPSIA